MFLVVVHVKKHGDGVLLTHRILGDVTLTYNVRNSLEKLFGVNGLQFPDDIVLFLTQLNIHFCL